MPNQFSQFISQQERAEYGYTNPASRNDNQDGPTVQGDGVGARILKAGSTAIPVLLDIEQQLQRELLGHVVQQQTDLELIDFNPPHEPRGAEFAISTKLLEEFNRRYDCELVVVITSVERYGPTHYRDVCARWLDEFPELFIIAVSWTAGTIFTLQREIREDEIPNQLDEMLAAIREIAS